MSIKAGYSTPLLHLAQMEHLLPGVHAQRRTPAHRSPREPHRGRPLWKNGARGLGKAYCHQSLRNGDILLLK